mmetsp:Transcript_34198/g.72820  ORF Transcript_34198/g.72820 Transcript_34198/m.72820 type:complete len:202 (+) Transcript_34198:627-1232(+)
MNGPISVKRRPKPLNTAPSTASGSATPHSTMCKHSRYNAACNRAARKPSISFFKITGFFPQLFRKSLTRPTGVSEGGFPSAAAAAAVHGQTSTRGTRWAGPMKWAATNRVAPASVSPLEISVTESDEVFVQSTVEEVVKPSNSLNMACLIWTSSAIVSKTNAAPVTASFNEEVGTMFPQDLAAMSLSTINLSNTSACFFAS